MPMQPRCWEAGLMHWTLSAEVLSCIKIPVMKYMLLSLGLMLALPGFGQSDGYKNPHPMDKWFVMSAYEFVFSMGDVQNMGVELDNPVRFTPVFNPQSQWHLNFADRMGIYTGLGIRNVGIISRFQIVNEDEITLKQRAYSIGLPVALKFGNMERGNYLAVGVEAECMFHYRKKILQGSYKTSDGDWFSSDVNIFNPSVFADIRFHNGTFFRFRYYLMDFLDETDQSFYLPVSGRNVAYVPTKSTLFCISIGTAIKIRVKHKMKKEEA